MVNKQKTSKIGLIVTSVVDFVFIIFAVLIILKDEQNVEGNYWFIANWVHLPLFLCALLIAFSTTENKKIGLSIVLIALIAFLFDVTGLIGRISLILDCSGPKNKDPCKDYETSNYLALFLIIGWILLDIAYFVFGYYKYTADVPKDYGLLEGKKRAEQPTSTTSSSSKGNSSALPSKGRPLTRGHVHRSALPAAVVLSNAAAPPPPF